MNKEAGPVLTEDSLSQGSWRLVVTAQRTELRLSQPDAPGPVYVDFVAGPLGYSRRVPGSRLLFRAIGPLNRVSRVIDATAGLGRDAFIMAHWGYDVTAIERSATVAALLEDGIRRAMLVPGLHELIRTRLHLIVADARQFLQAMPPADAPDVVYLDPMFPPRTKSAMVKKESLVLRQIVGEDSDAAELLAAARKVTRRHVVVKRMRHAPPIATDVMRSYPGKTTRYDLYGRSE